MIYTNVKLPETGAKIRFGDVIKAQNKHDVLVMCHPDHNEPIVAIMDSDLNDIWFFLDEYIRDGHGLSVERNINIYEVK